MGAIHLQKEVMKVSFVTSFFCIACYLILIPPLQELGCAITIVVTQVVNFLLLSNVLRKFLVKKTADSGKFFRLLLASVLMGGLLFLFKGYNLMVLIIGAMLFYTLAIILLKVVTWEEFSYLLKLVRKK